MKRKPRGRPKKSVISQRRWLAVAAAIELRYALKLMRDFASKKWTDGHAEFEAITRQEKAWHKFGMTVCVRCVQFDKPSEFLRQIADELDGKLKFSVRDYEIAQAYWAPGQEAFAHACAKASGNPGPEASLLLGEHCRTWREFKAYFERLFGSRDMPRDFVLRRSLKRLGYTLSPS
jgi:hypothetical protein